MFFQFRVDTVAAFVASTGSMAVKYPRVALCQGAARFAATLLPLVAFTPTGVDCGPTEIDSAYAGLCLPRPLQFLLTPTEHSKLLRGLTRCLVGVLFASSIAYVAAAGEHSIFLCRDGSMWVCGSNAEGQLGLFSAPQQPLLFAALPQRMPIEDRTMYKGLKPPIAAVAAGYRSVVAAAAAVGATNRLHFLHSLEASTFCILEPRTSIYSLVAPLPHPRMSNFVLPQLLHSVRPSGRTAVFAPAAAGAWPELQKQVLFWLSAAGIQLVLIAEISCLLGATMR